MFCNSILNPYLILMVSNEQNHGPEAASNAILKSNQKPTFWNNSLFTGADTTRVADLIEDFHGATTNIEWTQETNKSSQKRI